METLRIHNIVHNTKVLGPGNRVALWLQGCNRSCRGCMSPSTRNPNGGKLIAIDKLAAEILQVQGVEGITISGGEPFLQSRELCLLLRKLRFSSKLGVIIYTGFTVEELHALKDEYIEEILGGLADLIIDGEYVEELNEGSAWKGSSNQRLIFLTDRYKEHEPLYESKKRDVEVIVNNEGLFFIGIPEKQTLNQWERISQNYAEKSSKSAEEHSGGRE